MSTFDYQIFQLLKCFSVKKGKTLLSFLDFYLSQAIIYYYAEMVPRETFFKFVQVGMKHHYDNA